MKAIIKIEREGNLESTYHQLKGFKDLTINRSLSKQMPGV